MYFFKSFLVFLFVTLFFAPQLFAAPVILYSGVDKPEVYPEKYWDVDMDFTFSLVVTDSLGLEKIAGAVLIDPIKNVPYGTFQAGTQKGAFQITLTQKQIIAVRGWDPFSAKERIFDAVVFNSKGQSTTSSIRINYMHPTEFNNIKLDSPNLTDLLSKRYNLTWQPVDKVVNGVIKRGEVGWTHEIKFHFRKYKYMVGDTLPPFPDVNTSPLDKVCTFTDIRDTDYTTINIMDEVKCHLGLQRFQEACTQLLQSKVIVEDTPLLNSDGSVYGSWRSIRCQRGLKLLMFRELNSSYKEDYITTPD